VIEQDLRAIVAKVAETSPDFPLTAHLRDDVGVDSVRAFEIVFEIEKVLGIAVPEDKYAEVRTFKDLLVVVEALKGK
jgi:acyl carrier protein